jgi:hypothetical protein
VLRRIVLTTILLCVGAVVAVVVAAGICAARAEENLHATIFVVRLVEQFVNDNGRWPISWKELEQMPFPGDAPSPMNNETTAIRIGGAHGYRWPAQAIELRSRVRIDFDVNVRSVITQDPMEFKAICPIGPYYEFRDYGFVQSLQESLKKATESHDATSHSRKADSPPP